jgi:uncharacterized coiled-coil DUF342 family protein
VEAGAYEEQPGVLAYRVRKTAETVKVLEEWRREVDREAATTKQELRYLTDEIKDLTESFNSLRKTLLGFAFTVAGSALVFALTVLLATGRVG